MRGIAVACVTCVLVVAAAMALEKASVAFAASGTSADSQASKTSDAVLGKTLYEQHCAACHDHAVNRAPPKEAIAGNSRAFIISALQDGIMKMQAMGLSSDEIGDIAAYLSREQGSSARNTPTGGLACSVPPPPLSLEGSQWNGWGRDEESSRYQPDPGLSATDVPRLKLKWALGTKGSKDGEAVVAGGWLFSNDMSGAVYALNAKTGCAYWHFTAAAGTRTTMVIAKLASSLAPTRFAVYFADFHKDVYALDAETGKLLWKTHVDDQLASIMTGSLALHDGRLYVPVSSAEEAFAAKRGYTCCKFRGAVVALDAATGQILWKTYTSATEPHPFKNATGVTLYGPAGAAIWSAPTIDAKRKLIYVSTGNSYTDEYNEGADSVMAMDMDTGAVRWIDQMEKADTFIIGCPPAHKPPNCPTAVGPDHDLGVSPILHHTPGGKDMILVGQKSSQVYALDPDDHGKVIWTQWLSGGGALGGVEFGPASDTDNFYVAISDIFVRTGARPGLTAIQIADGKILWNTPSAPTRCSVPSPYCSPALSQAITAIPGIVFAGAMNGHFRAYSTKDGAVVWDFDTATGPITTIDGGTAKGGALNGAGPTVAGGMVYVHSGYGGATGGGSGGVLLAFSVDGT